MEQNNGSNNQKNNNGSFKGGRFGGHRRPYHGGGNKRPAPDNRVQTDDAQKNAVPAVNGNAPKSSAPVQNTPATPKAPQNVCNTPAVKSSDEDTDWLNDIPDFEPKKKPEINYVVTEEEINAILDDNKATEDDRPRTEVVGIRFKKVGKMYYFDPNGMSIKTGESVIVETARGMEFGQVCLTNTKVLSADIVLPLRPVLRIATPEDIKHNDENNEKEIDAFKICIEKIAAHELDMKLVDAQYTFDNAKLIFYFTSAGRVDFRELVKDLASVFRTRIELRQIGIRDEAKLMGGLGACGRPLCCASFLSDFVQVSIKMAKEQSLSLNSNKISGACGRLMCCLRYEYDVYNDEISRTPPVDSVVESPDGRGVVIETNPLAGKIKVKLFEKTDNPAKFYNRDDCKVLEKPQREEEKNQ